MTKPRKAAPQAPTREQIAASEAKLAGWAARDAILAEQAAAAAKARQ